MTMGTPGVVKERSWARWPAVLGLALGALPGFVFPLPDLLHRLDWAARGGGGETSHWGEPLFYQVVLMVPGAVVGLGVALLAQRLVRWLRRPLP
jgi:hypothetical protein